MYNKVVKPLVDTFLSFLAVIILALPMAVIAVVIKLDDPGPAVFKQKRVGKDKSYFSLYKFRSMKTDTPDIPTHLMTDPEKYITGVGGFIRKTSLDELPQIFNILTGKMAIIGPRPALWNQDDLIAERDKYGVNALRPGLTGWAQINGRDELEIPEKAKLDGEYAAAMKKGGLAAFSMDLKCFFGSFKSVLKHDGFVEGGTGQHSE